jgi:hypothetical protein
VDNFLPVGNSSREAWDGRDDEQGHREGLSCNKKQARMLNKVNNYYSYRHKNPIDDYNHE